MLEALHPAGGIQSDNSVIPSLRSRTSLSHVDNVAKNPRPPAFVAVFMKIGTKFPQSRLLDFAGEMVVNLALIDTLGLLVGERFDHNGSIYRAPLGVKRNAKRSPLTTKLTYRYEAQRNSGQVQRLVRLLYF